MQVPADKVRDSAKRITIYCRTGSVFANALTLAATTGLTGFPLPVSSVSNSSEAIFRMDSRDAARSKENAPDAAHHRSMPSFPSCS